jgi:hypothetical protein
MNKPDTLENTRSEEVADCLDPNQLKPGKHGAWGFSIVASMQRFRELDWADRLNLILAAILGCALVLALSPLLLVSWICMQLAKPVFGFRRPANLRTNRQA